MQEIKQLIMRLGASANEPEGIMTGPMADAHIQGYLNQDWTLFAVNPGSIDQGTSSLSVHYVLTREQEADVEDQKYDTEASEWLDKASQPLVSP